MQPHVTPAVLAKTGRIFLAALAGWTVLVAAEAVLLFAVLRMFAAVIGPELLPSLKVVLDMGSLAACGWVAGRIARPHHAIAATAACAGLALVDLTPYLPLQVGWLLRLAANTMRESRYLSSLLTTVTVHALLFGSVFAGAYLSRPPQPPTGLRLGS